MHALTIAAALVLVVSGRAQAEPSSCDTPAASRTLSIPLPGSPFMTVVTRDGCWVFASLAGGQKPGLAVLRRAGGRIELFRTVPLRGGLTGLVLTHDGELLIGTDGEGVVMMTVKRLIAAEQQDPLVATIHGMAGAVYANVTSNDELLFVSNERARSISVIDLGKARSSADAATATIGKIPVGYAPVALRFSPDERWLYTTSQSAPAEWVWPAVCDPENSRAAAQKHAEGAIVVIDVARSRGDPSHAVVARVPAGCNPVRLTLSPAGDRIYVTARGSHALLVFNTAALLKDAPQALLGKIPVGQAPVPVVVTDAGKTVIVGNSNRFGAADAGTLTVLDATKIERGAEAVTGSIASGAFPRDLTLTPDGRSLLVANFGSRSLQVMDAARLPIEKVKAPER